MEEFGLIGSIIVYGSALVLTYLLLKFKAKHARKHLETYLQESDMEATIEKVGIPPLRLWLKNRKGDSWARLHFASGERKWVRIRRRLRGTTVDGFDA